MRPPARCAAAIAWATKGLARCAFDDRMRPGRTWKSIVPVHGTFRDVRFSLKAFNKLTARTSQAIAAMRAKLQKS